MFRCIEICDIMSVGGIMISRELYLKQIRPFYDQDLIKVLVGIRRCGKSIALKQIQNEIIENGVLPKQIISLNFEDYSNRKYRDSDVLHEYLVNSIIDDELHYIFLDEIQEVKEWELVINSLKATRNVSIFITGSNSKILSGELATNLAGRYVSFDIYPFNFEEYLLFTEEDKDKAFMDYITFGSMPQSLIFTDQEQKFKYLSDLYDSIILKDIVERYNIKDVGQFKTLLEFFMTNPSQMFSPKSLSKFMESENRKLSSETVYNYLEYLQNTFILSKVDSYDIRGKRMLTRQSKYYLADLGFVSLVSQGKKKQIGAILENIVYNELKIKGYEVYIGNLKGGEVDFICQKNGEKFYVQVAYLLASEDTISREFSAYEKIDDNHTKYVVSMDKFDMSQDGVIHKNIIDFIFELI